MIKFGSQVIAIKGIEKGNGRENLRAEMLFLIYKILVLTPKKIIVSTLNFTLNLRVLFHHTHNPI